MVEESKKKIPKEKKQLALPFVLYKENYFYLSEASNNEKFGKRVFNLSFLSNTPKSPQKTERTKRDKLTYIEKDSPNGRIYFRITHFVTKKEIDVHMFMPISHEKYYCKVKRPEDIVSLHFFHYIQFSRPK